MRIYTILTPLILISVFIGSDAYSQQLIFHGTVKDELTLSPIPDVNVVLNGSGTGVFTDKEGNFSLALKKIPSSLEVTCIGYKPLYYEIKKAPLGHAEIILRRNIATLQEVSISAKRYNYVFKDLNFSVLDYEMMDDNLLLLVFRYQLRNSELILLKPNGDTLIIVKVPEQKPVSLYKDFLGNIHYISSKGNAFQCFYNDWLKKFGFVYKCTFDSLKQMTRSFLFTSGDRFYFQETTPDGSGTNIGYYDTSHHKQYIRNISDATSRQKYLDDLAFNNRWSRNIQNTSLQLQPRSQGYLANENPLMTRDERPVGNVKNQQAFTTYEPEGSVKRQSLHGKMLKISDDKIAVFNFPHDIIEMLNNDGKIIYSVPISFHKREENQLVEVLKIFIPIADWEWNGDVLFDEYYREAYAVFKKNGMIQIRKIDIETGNISNKYDLPFAFPKKIEIYRGYAYFLNREIGGENEKWKLVKVKL